MAQPVFYQTVNQLGMDPTVYYAVSASTTPETPAAPFQVGTRAFGSDGSEFVFVQASTTINPTDFIAINIGSVGGGSYQANSVTSTNIVSSLIVGLASTGLILRQSVTNIPAGAFFWAQTRGQYIPATTSGGTGGLATGSSGIALFTTATAGVLTSVTTSSTLALAIAGIICVNSLTISIASSLVPSAGTGSNGFTVGPVVSMNNPRSVVAYTTADGLLSLAKYAF